MESIFCRLHRATGEVLCQGLTLWCFDRRVLITEAWRIEGEEDAIRVFRCSVE